MTPTDTQAVTITEHLPVKIDMYRERFLLTEQRDGRMEELRLTEYLNNVTSMVKAKIKTEQKRQTDAARASSAGFEMQDVAIEQKVEGDKMVTYRLDMNTVVRERALTKEEMAEARKVKKQ